MIRKLITSLVVGVVTYLICILVGGAISTINPAIVASVGAFLVQYAALLGLLAAVWYYFNGNPVG